MTQLLFRSKWIALAWAISLCLTIARFFGAGGGSEGLQITHVQVRSGQKATPEHQNPWALDKRPDDEAAAEAGD